MPATSPIFSGFSAALGPSPECVRASLTSGDHFGVAHQVLNVALARCARAIEIMNVADAHELRDLHGVKQAGIGAPVDA